MTTKDKLLLMDDMERTNRARIEAWKAEGKLHVSPTEAAKVLDCAPYSLNVSAKAGHMPKGSYFFAGRNLRIMVPWLETAVGGAGA